MKLKSHLFLASSLTTVLVLCSSAFAVDRTKADNTTNLDLSGSWDTLPTSSDVAVWSGAYNTAGSLSAGFTASTPVSWQGIRIGSISGTAAGLTSIGGTGTIVGSQITIGGAGIDMSLSNQNAVINAATVVLGSSQTWNVASGKNLRFGTTGTGAANSKITGGSGVVITVQGGGLVDLNQGTGNNNGLSAYGGKWIVGSGATLRGLRNNAEAFGTNTAADSITLSGGTLAVGGISGTQGNWSWSNNITLTSATNSTISGQNFYTGTATARTLDFTGAIVGSGNLTFSKTQTDTQTFALKNFGTIAGVRTNIMGSGNVTISGVTLAFVPAAGTAAGLSYTHNNNITLIGGTLQSLDGIQTFAGDISLEGANTIVSNYSTKNATLNGTIKDGGVAGSLTYKPGQAGASHENNTIFVNGHNTYTGDTTLGDTGANKGIVVAKYGDAFGTTGTVQIRGAQLQAGTAGITIGNAFAVGAGGFRLGGSNNFTLSGTTSIDGFSRSIGNYGSATITLGNISTIADSVAAFDQAGVGGKIIINGNISGAGAVAVSAGNVTLNGTNNYSGTTTISGGIISGTGSITNSVVTMSGGSIVLPGGATTASLTMSSGVTFSGAPTVKFTSTPNAATVYDILTYGGGSVTGISNLSVYAHGNLSNDTGNSKYIFTADGAQTRTWNTTTGTWQNGVLNNWLEDDNKFYDGDNVVFSNIASNSTITLSGNLAPGSVSVTNAANTYTFTGGAITGTTGLTKSGNGTLQLSAANSFTGNVLVSGGELQTSGTSSIRALGADTVGRTITINNGATLKFMANDTFGGGGSNPNLSLIISGTVTNATSAFNTLGAVTLNSGSLVSTGGDSAGYQSFSFSSSVTATGASTMSSSGTNSNFHLGSNTSFEVTGSSDLLTVSGVLMNRNTDLGGAGGLTKTGAGTLTFSGANIHTGTTTLTAGTLKLSNSLALQSSTLATSAGTLVFDSSVVSNAFTFGGLSGSSNIALQNNAGSPAAIALSVGNNNASTSFSGVLSGAGALVKVGTGTLTLSGANTYTGVTTIKGNNGTNGAVSVSTIGNGGVAGNLGQATNIAGNLIFGENGVSSGKLTYTGAGESTDRLFTVAGNAIVENNGTGALNFTNTGAIAHGSGTHNLTLGGSYSAAANTFSSSIVNGSGTTNLIKSGAGTWILTNSNGYTGSTSISGGGLQLNGTVSATSSIILTGSDSAFSVATGGNLTNTGNFTLQGSVATGGIFNQTGGVTNLTTTTANAIVIGGANNTFGKMNISGGTFNAKGVTTQLTYYGSVRGELNVSASGTANFFGVNMNASGSGNGTINLTGGTLNIGTGGITNTGSGTSTINLGAGTLGVFGGDWSSSLAMKLTSTTTGATFNTLDSVDSTTARTITLSGVISGTDGKLNKDGAGTLILSGTNSYTGETKVNAGTLIISGNITSSSLTTVALGATIMGSGTVGALTVDSGASLKPGNSPGTLFTGNLTMAGTYTADLTSASSDLVDVTGSVTLSGLLALTSDFTATNGTLFFILKNDGADAISGTFSGLAEGDTVIDNLLNEYTITYLANYGSGFTGGNDVALMAIPESSTSLLGAFGALVLLRRRRK